jgi:hypothetical protein
MPSTNCSVLFDQTHLLRHRADALAVLPSLPRLTACSLLSLLSTAINFYN